MYKLAIFVSVAVYAITLAATAPPCRCHKNWDPVCGSNGKTYGNSCYLACKNYRSGKNITIVKQDPCEDYTQDCTCPSKFKPVCGNDGNTYPNRCELLCKKSELPELDVASEGACSDGVNVAESPCVCTLPLDYVCGSDENTYDNICQLNCAAAKNPSLSIEGHGTCKNVNSI